MIVAPENFVYAWLFCNKVNLNPIRLGVYFLKGKYFLQRLVLNIISFWNNSWMGGNPTETKLYIIISCLKPTENKWIGGLHFYHLKKLTTSSYFLNGWISNMKVKTSILNLFKASYLELPWKFLRGLGLYVSRFLAVRYC